MIPLEVKNIFIRGSKYDIKKSPRAYLKFEELSQHSISDFDSSTKDSLHFLYSCLWGGGLRISYDEFLDLIDDEDIALLIGTFIKAITSQTPVKEKKKRTV